MLLEVARPVRGGPTRATASTKLKRSLEMAEFYAEPGNMTIQRRPEDRVRHASGCGWDTNSEQRAVVNLRPGPA
jgi:hypothetical protein